ncbi:MAG: hypothetical protein WBP45_10810 [Daejeonella sp.]
MIQEMIIDMKILFHIIFVFISWFAPIRNCFVSTDQGKWTHLQSISKCQIDEVGTNENKAIVNLIKRFSPAYLNTKVNENTAFFMNIYERLGNNWKMQFTAEVTKLLSQAWTGQEELKNVYAEETPVPDNISGEHVISCFGTSGKQLDFGYSHFYKCKDGLYSDKPCYGNGGGTELINLNDKCTGKFSLSGNSPVMIIVNHKQLVVPAFIAGEIMKTQISEGYKELLSLNVGLLLPELLIKPATLAKWSKFFKGQGVVSNAGSIVRSAEELADFVAQYGIRGDINLDFVISMTKGRRDLCESILLSTKEVVEGKNLQQLVQHFNIPNTPSVNSLTNYQARIWYKSAKANISNIIDKTKKLEQQAKQVFDLRNTYRTQTRQFMKDRKLAEFLEQNELNRTWGDLVNKFKNEGYNNEQIWNKIIEDSQKGRENVDKLFMLYDL